MGKYKPFLLEHSFAWFIKQKWHIAEELLPQLEILKRFPQKKSSKDQNKRQTFEAHIYAPPYGLSNDTLFSQWEDSRNYRPASPFEFLGFLKENYYGLEINAPLALLHKQFALTGKDGRKATMAFLWKNVDGKNVPALDIISFPAYQWEEKWGFLEIPESD